MLLATLPLMRYQVFVEVDARVREDIAEEIEAFERFRSEASAAGELTRQKSLNQPALETAEDFERLMDVFLEQRIPEDDTFLIAVVGSKIYKTSPRALPPALASGQPLLKKLKRIDSKQMGEISTADPGLGKLLYTIEPVHTKDDRLLGKFLIVHTTAGERQEALNSLNQASQVLIVLTALVLALGWWLSGRVLAPLRTLSLVTQQVGESDLSQRIPIQGQGELAKLAQTFNEMMIRLDAAFQTQRHLLNDVGHELRTPITIIRGHLELMGDDPLEIEETRELLLDEVDRMGRLVNELILLAKCERPDFLNWDSFDLPVLMAEILAKVQALGDRVWQLDEVSPDYFRGDRQRLTEALLNLADNAVRHTQPNDTIALGCRTSESDLLLWVRDTGEGIPSADQARIFERFARISTQRRSEGSGLGLTIVKAIAEAHGGRVELASQLGQGAKFTLVLPRHRFATRFRRTQ